VATSAGAPAGYWEADTKCATMVSDNFGDECALKAIVLGKTQGVGGAWTLTRVLLS